MCGANYVKFQKRSNKYLLGKNYFKKHPNQIHSFGNTYGEHRDKLEFSIKEHLDLSDYCKNKIKYSTSVWEVKSAEGIINSKLNPDFLKVPSPRNLDFELLEILAKKFKKKVS